MAPLVERDSESVVRLLSHGEEPDPNVSRLTSRRTPAPAATRLLTQKFKKTVIVQARATHPSHPVAMPKPMTAATKMV